MTYFLTGQSNTALSRESLKTVNFTVLNVKAAMHVNMKMEQRRRHLTGRGQEHLLSGWTWLDQTHLLSFSLSLSFPVCLSLWKTGKQDDMLRGEWIVFILEPTFPLYDYQVCYCVGALSLLSVYHVKGALSWFRQLSQGRVSKPLCPWWTSSLIQVWLVHRP